MPGQVVGRFQNAILRKHPIMPVIDISRSRATARENGKAMALSEEQRRELDRLTIENVRLKLAYSAAEREAVVPGLGDGMILRGDVEDWLAEMARLDAKERAATLRWARIAGWAGIMLVALTVLTTILGTLLDWALGRLPALAER